MQSMNNIVAKFLKKELQEIKGKRGRQNSSKIKYYNLLFEIQNILSGKNLSKYIEDLNNIN